MGIGWRKVRLRAGFQLALREAKSQIRVRCRRVCLRPLSKQTRVRGRWREQVAWDGGYGGALPMARYS